MLFFWSFKIIALYTNKFPYKFFILDFYIWNYFSTIMIMFFVFPGRKESKNERVNVHFFLSILLLYDTWTILLLVIFFLLCGENWSLSDFSHLLMIIVLNTRAHAHVLARPPCSSPMISYFFVIVETIITSGKPNNLRALKISCGLSHSCVHVYWLCM